MLSSFDSENVAIACISVYGILFTTLSLAVRAEFSLTSVRVTPFSITQLFRN